MSEGGEKKTQRSGESTWNAGPGGTSSCGRSRRVSLKSSGGAATRGKGERVWRRGSEGTAGEAGSCWGV